MIDDEDVEAWYNFPNDRNFFNKLWLADQLGHKCGPGGIPVPDAGTYIVRPTYNLAGMGVGAKKMELSPEEWNTGAVPAGYFWCEWFEGEHLSLDYVREGRFGKMNWSLVRCYRGEKRGFEFDRWDRVDISDWGSWKVPSILVNPLWYEMSASKLNLETIGGRVIEAHFRHGFDHMEQYETIYPIFKEFTFDKPKGFTWIEGPATGYGQLDNPRLGYWVK